MIPVAEVHTHLGRHAEESGDQVVSLEQAVHVHLLDKHGERLDKEQEGKINTATTRRIFLISPKYKTRFF